MANYKSSIKRIRQTKKRREHNIGIRSGVRTAIKKTLAAVESGDKAAAQQELREAIKAIDSATGKGLYKGNNGARKVSRLTKRVNELG